MDKMSHLIAMVTAMKEQLDQPQLQQSEWKTQFIQEKNDKSEEVFQALLLKTLEEFNAFQQKMEDKLFRK
jgi:hypothetical protein